MTTRRPRSRSFRRTPQKTLWEQISPTGSLASGAEQTSDLTADIVAEHETRAKATRLIGKLWVGDPGVSGKYTFALGIGIMSLDGFNGGNVPDPLTDLDHSWWFHEAVIKHFSGSNDVQMPIDIKTSRNLQRGFRLILVAEAGSNPSTIEWSFTARLLWTIR